jgi:O-methyltransferase
MLNLAAQMISGLPGSVAEVGVFKGKGAFHMAGLFPDKTLHLFDTFTGMPDTIEEIDGGGWAKYSNTSLAAVQHMLKGFDNVQIHPGVFPDTGVVLPTSERFCLVHVDVDLYRSTLDVCTFFYDRMVPGGIMVLNDYRCSTCPGATKAVDEFFADKPEKIVSRGNEHTWVIKL